MQAEPDWQALAREAEATGLGPAGEVLPLVYDELRRLAARQLAGERAGHTLAPTALVHEAWLKLEVQTQARFRDRAHFLALAALAMRRILVSHAERRRAEKRGGGRAAVTWTEGFSGSEGPRGVRGDTDPLDLLALEQALEALALVDPRKAKLVELRFFGGLDNAEAAGVLGVAERTVERDWRLAQAFLRREIERGSRD
jgi:RNA polymerase sigma factor (TIGR02999 family)